MYLKEQEKNSLIKRKGQNESKCSVGNVYNKVIPKNSPEINDFSKMILKNVLAQNIIIDRNQKQAIFKNVEKLDFKVSNTFGALQILNKESCVPVLVHDNVTLIASEILGSGRAISVAHQCIFTQFMALNDDWIIFLRNLINWTTKNKVSSKENRIKILMTSSSPNFKTIQSLERASLYIQINYQCSLAEINLSQYDCLFLYDLSLKTFSEADCKKVIEFVRNGGGLVIALRGWVFKNYGEGKQMKDWVKQCTYNKILEPLGLRFTEDFTTLNQIKLKPKQTIKLVSKPMKPYLKQQSQYTQDYNSKERDILKKDRKILLDGVGDCTFGGKGDDSIAISSFSFPENSCISIFRQQGQDFCVAGRIGKGKIFLFSHPCIYDKKFINQNSHKKFIQNIMKWMCGEKKNISLGLFLSGGQWPGQLSLKQVDLKATSKIVDNIQDLKNIDILCASYYSTFPKKMTSELKQKVKQFVEKGGNLFFASHGWVWQNYGEHQTNNKLILQNDFASYVLLKIFGITLKNDCFGISNPFKPVINSESKDQQIYGFLKNDLMKVLRNKSIDKFDADDQKIKKYLSKLNSTNPSQFQVVCSFDLYHQIVDAFVQSRFNIEKHYDELPFSDPFICNVFNLMNALSYACPPHICRALPPSLNTYPGYASKRIASRTVQVFKNRNKIVFTGLYINPGQAVKIKHNNDNLTDVELKVNFNNDLTNCDNGKLKRFVHIAHTYKIKSKQFLIASPHGGIIYFSIQSKSTENKPLLFTFQGAYEAPYWNQNIHSYADFDKIKKIDAPFFVIETKRMNLIGPTKRILPYLNIKIEKLSQFWNTVVGHYKNYRGIQQYPFEKQAYFNDANIMLGYMHSGTPVMTHEDLAFEMIGVGGKLFTNATWGFYHELGHNHQDYKWTFDETVEVTCNIYSLYLINKMHGISIKQNMWIERNSDQIVKKYFSNSSRTLKQYGQDPFLGLVLYAVLMEQFGYEIFSEVHKRYNNINLQLESSVEAKVDMLVEQVSIVTGHNLWQYFKNWGMPVTKKSLQKIKNLKKYNCKKFPYITQN